MSSFDLDTLPIHRLMSVPAVGGWLAAAAAEI